MSRYFNQFEYLPMVPKLAHPISDRPLPSSFYNASPTYNSQILVTPAVQIGHHTYVPASQNDAAFMQPPGRPVDEAMDGRTALRNVAGYVKPGYTVY